MGKKVLFISYNGMTDPLGQAQVLPYLFGLSQQGYQITVLSVEKKDRMVKDGRAIRDLIEKGGLSWHPLTFHKSLPVISKIYDRYLMQQAARKICCGQKIDLVHCRSYVSAEVGLKLKKEFDVPFIFDMRGFWADEKKDSGHWNIKNPVYSRIYRHYKHLEKKLLTNANAVVVLTHAAKEEISRWGLGMQVADKIRVVPCCADLEHFSTRNVNWALRTKLMTELQLDGVDIVPCYLGSIGEAYAINEMLYFFSRLKQRHPNAKFLFLTKDPPQLVLDRLTNFPALTVSDVAVRFASRGDVPTYLSLCNFSIFFYKPTYSRIACSPTKFAEISGLGLPVICNTVGDLNPNFLKELPHAVITDLGQQSIDASVDLVDGFRQADKNAIRNFALKQYNLDDGVRNYQLIYEALLK